MHSPVEDGRFAAADSLFKDVQREHFTDADVEHFRWTTSGAGFAETEDALLLPLLSSVREPFLEIGCGEGNNLARLGRVTGCVGVDLFFNRVAFAAKSVPGVRYVTGDATALPLRSARFNTVFIRDLLHHVAEPSRVLGEAVRVLAPGGRLCLLEPNGRNPLVNLQTRLVRAELGARRSGTAHIEELLRGLPLTDVQIRTEQALPLRRMVLHYRFGLPALGRIAAARHSLAFIERALGRLLPRSRWSYVVATARRVGETTSRGEMIGMA